MMLNQSTAIITVLLAILSVVLPRKYRLVPFITAACFVPTDQRIIIGGLDFTVLRVLIVITALRIWLRGEIVLIRWNRFDYILLSWITCGAIVFSLQMANMAAVINRCGVMFDLVGCYWLCRQCVRSWTDIKLTLMIFAICVCGLVPFVANEWITGQNPFAALGRVSTWVRGERYRCQASFVHAIAMGLFWATLIPLFLSVGIIDRRRILYWGAAILGVFCVAASASATPLMVLLLILPLFVLFKWRHYSKVFVKVVLGVLLCLHIIMEASVWHLIARSSVLVGGATGWHRAHLIDETIRHFGEWALLGARSTAHWGYGLGDVTNQYILEGVRGGFITLAFFVWMLFTAIKTSLKFSQSAIQKDQQLLAWGICVSTIAHCIAFSGYAYFGQNQMLLYLHYAFVGFIYEITADSKSTSVVVSG